MEVYKDVIGYEGIYQVSNLGNVKNNKEKQLKLSKNSSNYLLAGLRINKVTKSIYVHQLVAQSFLNHNRCGHKLVVNHIDFDKTNNKLDNLEIITARENSNRKHLKSSSKYVGVSWNKRVNKWSCQIVINKKLKFLGYFKDELEASKAYQKELENLQLFF